MVNSKMVKLGWITAEHDVADSERGLDWAYDHFCLMDEGIRIDPDFRFGYGFVVCTLREKALYEAEGKEWPPWPSVPFPCSLRTGFRAEV